MSRATLWLWLTVIALRLAYAPLATQIDPLLRANPLHGDAILHDQMAWRLVSTGEYRLDKGLMTAPAYIYLMAGVYALAGHAPTAVRLLNALLGLLTLWGLWRLTHRLTGERAANLALLLGALHPHLLMITGWLYTENLALPLVVWAVYGLLYWRSGWGYAASGALLGLLALTRANFLPFVAIAGAWLLWRERGWRPPALLTVTTALLTVAPYVAYHLRAVWRIRPYRARRLCAAVGEQRVRRRRVRPALSGTHAHHRRRDEDRRASG
jgi:4-amino-4-deoxy-L-arabinose transferase-like glycosyltransferase